MTVASSDDNEQGPDTGSGPTPVPPRGGKRKPNRPTGKVTGKQAGQSAGKGGGARPAAGPPRPADNRRAALAQQKRRRQTLLAAAAIGVIVVVVGVIVAINLTSSPAKSNTAVGAVSQDSLDSFTSSVSLQDLKAAAENYPLGSSGDYPTVANDPPITKTGKPTLLYIGAEYCPYCATERWPLVLALSKFGTFHNLSAIHSSATDVHPNTATFSFYKSTYTSDYLTFTSKEIETIAEKPLQKLTAAQTALETKYDSGGSIPFVYLNGKAIISGAEYNPDLLAGKTFDQIADDIKAGTSTLASSVTANAGAIVSDICQMTKGQPGSVCKLFPKPVTS